MGQDDTSSTSTSKVKPTHPEITRTQIATTHSPRDA